MDKGLVIMAFYRLVDAEKTTGIGHLHVIDRRFQEPPLVDLAAEELDDRIRPCCGIQPASAPSRNAVASGWSRTSRAAKWPRITA